ncbi:hypothetical protein TPA0906_12390 [Streptomyces olivaceus]|nr:hypothetical protein TPA0906_12390 [Streptomyces olivaceus]
MTSEEAAEIRRLRGENAELRRANEILKAASAVFAAELDRQSKRSFPVERIREAVTTQAERHVHGKIVIAL